MFAGGGRTLSASRRGVVRGQAGEGREGKEAEPSLAAAVECWVHLVASKYDTISIPVP